MRRGDGLVGRGLVGRGSGDGCVTLTVANSTGGAVIHACGDHARTLCRASFTSEDRIALPTRTQCKIAGLGSLRPGTTALPRSRTAVGAALP